MPEIKHEKIDLYDIFRKMNEDYFLHVSLLKFNGM